MFAIMAKIYEKLYKQSSSIAFDETFSCWSAPKTPNFSAFHWSPRGSLVSIGQHFVATRVVHLPKSTETSLISESDQSGSNHQLLQLCTARTAWFDSDQVVRAVHSCNSWLRSEFRTDEPTSARLIHILKCSLLNMISGFRDWWGCVTGNHILCSRLHVL